VAAASVGAVPAAPATEVVVAWSSTDLAPTERGITLIRRTRERPSVDAMTFPVRRALAAATITAATAGALLAPASPASATPVDGYVEAYGYYRNAVGCNVTESNDGEAFKMFTPTTGRRTATTETDFTARDAGGNVTARGRVENTSSGVAESRNGAFDKVTFTSDHLVRVRDTRASDCRLGMIADTQSGAELHVEHRGRVHVEWDRGRAGRIEQIFVSRNGNVKVDKVRPSPHGETTFRVRPGNYVVFVQFVTRVNEHDIPTHTTLAKRTHFRVLLDYRR
jgi:hypothetical protein